METSRIKRRMRFAFVAGNAAVRRRAFVIRRHENSGDQNRMRSGKNGKRKGGCACAGTAETRWES